MTLPQNRVLTERCMHSNLACNFPLNCKDVDSKSGKKNRNGDIFIFQAISSSKFLYFDGFTSIPTALIANDRNRRIQVYQASDG